MGGVFARAFLRSGYPVIPVLRSDNIDEVAEQHPDPALVLVAVAEKDIHSTLDNLPSKWQSRLCLLQNELLPNDWLSHNLEDPTVISVWFEKKKGQDYKVIIPSPVYGPNAELVEKALASIDIPCNRLTDSNQLLFELIRKNVYILTTNIAGLVTGGTVATLWEQHRDLAVQVANEIIDIQDWITQQTSDRDALIKAMTDAFDGDPDHRCMGRSAPARLANAIKLADKARLDVPKLREIENQTE